MIEQVGFIGVYRWYKMHSRLCLCKGQVYSACVKLF